MSFFKFKSLCVFGGASGKMNPLYIEAAQKLGKILAEESIKLIYGSNGGGLMGIISNSVLDAGGCVKGILAEDLAQIEVPNQRLTHLTTVCDMQARKNLFLKESDGFIILPGGVGTLDEFFEFLVWKKIGLHTKPIVILNINHYWDSLYALMENIIQNDFAKPSARILYKFVDTVEETLPALQFLQEQE